MRRGSSRAAIKAFYDLKDVRQAIDAGKVNISCLTTRIKNKETLDELGLTAVEALEKIKELKPHQLFDVSMGTQYEAPADIYKKIINGNVVYIKFYMIDDLVILSFHADGR